jgi:hypothetical protein
MRAMARSPRALLGLLVVAERPDWSTLSAGAALKVALRAVAANETGAFVATGPRVSQLAVRTGTATDEWAEVSITSPGDPQEKALVDVAYGAGVWAACGFDDDVRNSHLSHQSLQAMYFLTSLPVWSCQTQYRSLPVPRRANRTWNSVLTTFSHR